MGGSRPNRGHFSELGADAALEVQSAAQRASGERVRVARIIIVATCRNGAPDTETAALARSLVGESGNAICALASVALSIPKNASRGEGILARCLDSGAGGNLESLRASKQASERHIGAVT